jgi:hypothetical protein
VYSRGCTDARSRVPSGVEHLKGSYVPQCISAPNLTRSRTPKQAALQLQLCLQVPKHALAHQLPASKCGTCVHAEHLPGAAAGVRSGSALLRAWLSVQVPALPPAGADATVAAAAVLLAAAAKQLSFAGTCMVAALAASRGESRSGDACPS